MISLYDSSANEAMPIDAIPFGLDALDSKLARLSFYFKDYKISYYLREDNAPGNYMLYVYARKGEGYCVLNTVLNETTVSDDTYATAIHNTIRDELKEQSIIEEAKEILCIQ